MVHSFLVNNISFVQSYEWNNLIIVFLEMIVGFIIFKLIPSIGRQGQNTTDSVGDADEIVVEEVDDLEVKKRKKPNWKIIIPLSLIFVLVLLYFFGQPFIVEKQNSNKITIESVDGSDGGSQDYIEKPYSELEIYFAQQLLNKAQQGDFQSSRLIKLIFGQEAESLTQSEINRLMEATTLGRYGRYHLSGGFSFYATNLLNRNVISTESILFILLNNRSLQTELLGGTLRNNNLSALIQVLKQKNISIADIPNKIVNLSQASSGGNNDIQKIAQANNLNIQDLEKFYANWKTNGLIWKTKRIDGMALMALRYSKVRDYLGISGSVQTIGQVVPSIKKKISQSNKKKYSDKVVDVSREIQKQMDPAMMQHDVGGIDFNRNLLNLDVEGLMIFDDASLQNDFSLNPQNVIGLEPIIAPVVPFVSGFSLGKSDSSSQDDDSHSSLEINCFVCLIRLTRSV